MLSGLVLSSTDDKEEAMPAIFHIENQDTFLHRNKNEWLLLLQIPLAVIMLLVLLLPR
ncbi:methionyl-tRNA formyltransferase [Mariprofundus ferrooxydans]|uniref:Methionyl-tRNA formyltransferase n=1 Tax=Mariprofundus ferrooxydans PV-1 TaxID=314345 RepID=Q0F0E6_9PROT|nr:methionyl-tRNA formyltransferase [Mariprofundus ferrooxydans PV-1]KON46877.1 methionyl-tRNA formyltransferase [Mariprofundus ferrooxydans]